MIRGQDKDLRPVEQLFFPVPGDKAVEVHVVRQSLRTDGLFQGLLILVSANLQPGFSGCGALEERHRLQQVENAFPGADLAEEKQLDGPAGLPRYLLPTGRFRDIVHDAHLLRGDADRHEEIAPGR